MGEDHEGPVLQHALPLAPTEGETMLDGVIQVSPDNRREGHGADKVSSICDSKRPMLLHRQNAGTPATSTRSAMPFLLRDVCRVQCA